MAVGLHSASWRGSCLQDSYSMSSGENSIHQDAVWGSRGISHGCSDKADSIRADSGAFLGPLAKWSVNLRINASLLVDQNRRKAFNSENTRRKHRLVWLEPCVHGAEQWAGAASLLTSHVAYTVCVNAFSTGRNFHVCVCSFLYLL